MLMLLWSWYNSYAGLICFKGANVVDAPALPEGSKPKVMKSSSQGGTYYHFTLTLGISTVC